MDPADSLQFLARYGLVIIPALVVAEQFGIPLPAVPALLGVGALAAAGQVSIPLVLGTIAAVALSVDFVWYELGRRRGADVLAKLCRTSPDSDSCVRRAKHVFARYGAAAMLVAKFVPGLTTVLPPLAGAVAIGRGRFALYELGGVLLWASTWIGLGYFFSDAISSIALSAARLGRVLGVVVVAAVGAYVLVRYLRRRLPLRALRSVPISREGLKARLVDLRTPFAVAAVPYARPGGPAGCSPTRFPSTGGRSSGPESPCGAAALPMSQQRPDGADPSGSPPDRREEAA
jgi:membrane protein DedA with SNARE-associated domain